MGVAYRFRLEEVYEKGVGYKLDTTSLNASTDILLR
jgi:hypothetical protein